MFTVTVSVNGGPKDSIYNVLAAKLKRTPTNAECKAEIDRILREARAAGTR